MTLHHPKKGNLVQVGCEWIMLPVLLTQVPVRRWFADSHQTSLHVRRPTHNILDWRSGVCLAVWSLLADEWGASKSPCLFHYLWGEGKDGDHIRKGHQGEGKIH